MTPRGRHLSAWTLAAAACAGVVAARVLVEPSAPAEQTVAAARPEAVRVRTVVTTRTVTVAAPAPRASRRRTRAQRPAQTRGSGSAPEQAPAPATTRRSASGSQPAREEQRSGTPRSGTQRRRRAAPTPKAPAGPQQVDGDAIPTRYGPVQVRLVLQGSRITDVVALVAPNDIPRSQQISADALPKLRAQVLAAQGAGIDGVAGATYTAQGYRQSVQSALDVA